MKKFTNRLKLAVIATVASVISLNASAQSPQSQPFLNGFKLLVTSTSTNTFGATNTYSKSYSYTNSGTYPYTPAITYTWLTNAAAIVDVALWADRDGTTPQANISVQMSGLNASFTNTGLFKFATIPNTTRSPDYPPGLFQAGTSANNLWSFSATGNGTNIVCISTNTPSALLQGNRGLRLLGVEWTNAGTNGTVDGIFLNGFLPIQ